MTAQEFINYWQNKQDHDDSPAVGIGVNWEKIPLDSTVIQYEGNAAWTRIGDFFAPEWGNFKRTKLNEWLNSEREDYEQFIAEEKSVGKIDLYRERGLIYPEFCAFTDKDANLGVLGDGCHRFIDFNYLLMTNEVSPDEIKKCKLDLICIDNLEEVLGATDYQIIKEVMTLQ